MDNQEAVQPSAKTVQIQVVEKAQFPWNKKIPFDVYVQTNVYANKLYVTASASAGHFIPDQKVLVNVNPGTYNIKLDYIPTEQGQINYTITASVITADSNYADSYANTLLLNSSLVRTPVTSGYLMYQISMWGIGILVIALLLLNLKKLLYFIKDKLIPSMVSKQAKTGI